MTKLFTLHKESENYVKIQKYQQEVDIMVEISTVFDHNLKPETTINILDHFMWNLGWAMNMSIGCKVDVGKYRSTHTIAEDLGITFGAGLKKLFYRKMQDEGINIDGFSVFGLDEALVRAMVNMEGRRNCFITYGQDCPGSRNEICEDILTADFVAFFEGFAQGFPATIHIDLLQGRDPHHVWESAFMALGNALRAAYATNPWRIAKNNPFYAEEGMGDASLI
ncbi:hypothetical protein DCMF_09385 [Candidatus Formimonas warabiya]|uniref:Imidazoleglycerol-phosphate dehydratase n=2 Tax=Formimonas warabiya TaxID=1761012 RepID=A0A3G1KR90_FORW1|nr:hypothetical protein DCMF_09385 [Candidatus Formimonas warabiya]